MALCGREDTFACRFADRGNNEVIPRPRAHGKGQLSGHRIADRGSGGVDHDPWDLKIKRLHQRVRNLEIQHEIRQIEKRIREIKLQQEIRKETESGYIIRDDVNEEEEYPSFNSYYPVFFEEDTPRFDEDEEEFGYTSPPVFDSYEDDEVVSLGFYHVSPVFDECEDEEEVSLDSGDDALGVEVINRGNVNVDGVHGMGSESYGIQIQKIDILPLKVVDNSKLYGHARVEDVTINNEDDLSMDENEFKAASSFVDMNFNKHVKINTSGSIRNNKIVKGASMEHGTIQKKPQLKERRHDVPFDPGGCGYDPKLKLEDEFFRRGGE